MGGGRNLLETSVALFKDPHRSRHCREVFENVSGQALWVLTYSFERFRSFGFSEILP